MSIDGGRRPPKVRRSPGVTVLRAVLITLAGWGLLIALGGGAGQPEVLVVLGLVVLAIVVDCRRGGG